MSKDNEWKLIEPYFLIFILWLKIFFDWLSSIVANSKKFEQLLEVNNYEEFMKEIIA